MIKINKIAIAVATFMAGSTYAAEADFIQYDIYGQIGGAMKTEEAVEAPTPNSLIEEDFGLYSDTHAVADIDFKFNKHLSIDTSTLVHFDEEEDPEVKVREAVFKGDFKNFDFKIGRFINPLYMNSSNEYRDFDRLTFRSNGFFNETGSAIEGLDGGMFGYKTKIKGTEAHFNIYSGIPTNIEGDSDVIVVDSNSDISVNAFNRDTEFTVTAENIMKTKKLGDFRFAVSYLDYSIDNADDDRFGEYIFDLGFKHQVNNLMLEAEFAHSILDISESLTVDVDKFYGVVGYNVHGFVPYVSYSMLDDELKADTEDALEFGVNYQINKHFKVKVAYEMLTDENNNDNDIISAGLAIKL
tara:strand:+ start:4836 stop:5900 length:1065 start_codon:yes stop_codon:yes gene_type:complete